MRARWGLSIVALGLIALCVKCALDGELDPTSAEPTTSASARTSAASVPANPATERLELATTVASVAAVAPAATSPTERRCTLAAQDELGAPIADAEFWLADERGAERLGSGDARGEFAAEAATLGGRELWAKAREHEARSLHVAHEPVQTLVLVLPRAAALRGTVRHHGAPKPKMRVVAWRSGLGPPCELLRTATPDDPRLLQTVSDAEGRFVVEGATRDVEYHVVAAGEGLVTQRKTRARADAKLELEVVELYGVRLVVCEVGGDPLRTSRAWSDSYAQEFLDLDDRAELLDGDEALCLLGLEGSPAVEDPFDFAYLSTRSDGAAVAGPLVVDLRLANYRPSKRRVDLPRVVTELTVKRLELEPTGAEFGALTVEFTGALAELSLADAQGNFLELVDEQDAKHRLALAHTQGVRRFEDLPIGRYRWRFHASDRFWSFPSGTDEPTVEIDATAPAIVIDWGDAGALDVRTPDDAERGTLWVRAVGRFGLHSFAFDGGRARLVGLAPDEYELTLQRQGDPLSLDRASFAARATVRARVSTSVELARR